MPHTEQCRAEAPEGYCIGGCALTAADLPGLAAVLRGTGHGSPQDVPGGAVAGDRQPED